MCALLALPDESGGWIPMSFVHGYVCVIRIDAKKRVFCSCPLAGTKRPHPSIPTSLIRKSLVLVSELKIRCSPALFIFCSNLCSLPQAGVVLALRASADRSWRPWCSCG